MIYRDGAHTCPRCGSELGERSLGRSCARCRGLWIDEEVLAQRWRQITGHSPLPTFSPRSDGAPRLECVACGSPMEKVTLGSVELDRCDGHGVWFDAGELQRADAVAAIQSQVPADRRDVEVMLSAELCLAELSARAGDDDDVWSLVGLAVAIAEEALRRWPDDASLQNRLSTLREKLALWSRGGAPR